MENSISCRLRKKLMNVSSTVFENPTILTSSENFAKDASVLQRRFDSSFNNNFLKLSGNDQTLMKQKLLLSLKVERKKKLVEHVGSLAFQLCQEDGGLLANHWPELDKFILELANNDDPKEVEVALILARYAPSVFGGKTQELQHQPELFNILHVPLEHYFERRHATDYSEEEMELFENMSQLTNRLLRIHGEKMMPMFDQLVSTLVKMMDGDSSFDYHKHCLSIFNQLIDHLGPISSKYLPYFLQPTLDSLCTADPSDGPARFEAICCCKSMAEKGGPSYAAACEEALYWLALVVNELKDDDKEEDLWNIKKSALGAATKILRWNSGMVNMEVYLPEWFGWLSSCKLTDVASELYDYLCELVEENNLIILGGSERMNVPRIVEVMTLAMEKEVTINIKVKDRMVSILRQAKTNVLKFDRFTG